MGGCKKLVDIYIHIFICICLYMNMEDNFSSLNGRNSWVICPFKPVIPLHGWIIAFSIYFDLILPVVAAADVGVNRIPSLQSGWKSGEALLSQLVAVAGVGVVQWWADQNIGLLGWLSIYREDKLSWRWANGSYSQYETHVCMMGLATIPLLSRILPGRRSTC